MRRRIHASEPDYPAGLRDLADAPEVVFVAGELPPLARAVAIVGTRRADALGLLFARELAADLARAGCTIVSGGAAGIDCAAHEGALDVGGRTLTVLPSDLEHAYPPRHRALFARITQQGALLSEHAVDPPRFRSVFLARNRLIAALAQRVLVVQAPLRSGALSTAAHARKLGRPVMAVPFAPWDVRGEGCLALLAQGAELCRSANDVLARLLPEHVASATHSAIAAPPRIEDADQRLLYEALSSGALAADELCERTGLSPARVQLATLSLLLAGEIQEVSFGRYARS